MDNDKIICTPMNIEYFDPDFYMSLNPKKQKNIKLNFEKDKLNLLNMRRKINKRG